VPDTAAFGAFRGQKLVLQYGGFGNLWNIPGTCVDRFTNQSVTCSGNQNERYVPAFVIPFDPVQGRLSGTTASGPVTYYAKWLERELRFRKLDASACAALTLPVGLTLPDGSDFHNPGPAGGATYIGVQPTVDGAPRVIDGDVKY
jgi:hypothetical protein